MTTYSMTPIKSGTRMRADHNVFASVIIGDLSPLDTLTGVELWEAPADGVEVKKGDKWLKVTHRNGIVLPVSGWTAYFHKGVAICNNFKVIDDTEPPAPVTGFPLSYELTNTDANHPDYGKKAEYVFVKEL